MKCKAPWRRWRKTRKRAVDRHMRREVRKAWARDKDEVISTRHRIRSAGRVCVKVRLQTAGPKGERSLAYRCRYQAMGLGDYEHQSLWISLKRG